MAGFLGTALATLAVSWLVRKRLLSVTADLQSTITAAERMREGDFI